MTIVDQLVQSPRLPRVVEELRHILDAEKVRREEFYDWLTEDRKAEFINGEVIVHSPVTLRHEGASSNLFRLLSIYVDRKGLGRVGHEKLLVSLTRNDYEPDICFWKSSKADSFVQDQLKFPAPDLAVEVLSPSTEKIDRKVKFEDYAAHGTDEYWIVDSEQGTIEQYLLTGEEYRLAVKVAHGPIRSRAIAGLEFPVPAAFDAQANLAALTAIMIS
ncbi:MAG TPA: Uma2 family endonuclease [Phycisphaerae bacterium]|nr:Uma2 family endonuclease [Phycisphaerae bacterium]